LVDRTLVGVVALVVVFAFFVDQAEQVAFAIVAIVQRVAGGVDATHDVGEAVVFETGGAAEWIGIGGGLAIGVVVQLCGAAIGIVNRRVVAFAVVATAGRARALFSST